MLKKSVMCLKQVHFYFSPPGNGEYKFDRYDGIDLIGKHQEHRRIKNTPLINICIFLTSEDLHGLTLIWFTIKLETFSHAWSHGQLLAVISIVTY